MKCCCGKYELESETDSIRINDTIHKPLLRGFPNFCGHVDRQRIAELESQNKTLRTVFSANEEHNEELMENVAQLEEHIEDCRELLTSVLTGDGKATMKRIEEVRDKLP
jgi:hypothetical protein